MLTYGGGFPWTTQVMSKEWDSGKWTYCRRGLARRARISGELRQYSGCLDGEFLRCRRPEPISRI